MTKKNKKEEDLTERKRRKIVAAEVEANVEEEKQGEEQNSDSSASVVASPIPSPSPSKALRSTPSNRRKGVIHGSLDDDSDQVSSESSSIENDEDDSSDFEGGIIDVDFEFFDPKPSDFHSVKNFFAQSFEKDVINLTELTDTLLAQSGIGTCVKIDGDSDALSFLSVLNLNEHKSLGCVKQLKSFLLSKLTGENQEKLKSYLDGSKSVGFIFNERLINMPVQTTPPMWKMLLEEMQWSGEEGKPYQFEYLIFLMKTYREKHEVTVSKGKKALAESKQNLHFVNEEEEFFLKDAEFQFDYKHKLNSENSFRWTSFQNVGIVPWRKIVVIKTSFIPDAIKTIENEVAKLQAEFDRQRNVPSSSSNSN